jgi:hypothetical protein
LVVGGLILAVAVAGVAMSGYSHDKQNGGTGTAPDPQTASTELPPQAVTASAPTEADQAATMQQTFRSLPDPEPPVALDTIGGVWWAGSKYSVDKVYAFVESVNLAAGPVTAHLRMPDGTRLFVECSEQYSVSNLYPVRPGDSLYKAGECDLLPRSTWIRVAMSDLVTNPDAKEWGMTYRKDDASPVESGFLVKRICYMDGTCATIDEAANRALGKILANNMPGNN